MAAADVPLVEALEARQRRDAGTPFLDVRTDEEWEAGHVAGSVWIPMQEIAARGAELPESPMVVVCRSGDRSGRVAVALRRAGYDAVNLEGGLLAWVDAGLPLVTDGGGPGVVA
jgi:rhodanese-related sulfurtransferase